MNSRTCLTIVLAAGEGTRMRSALPKVLHVAGGRTLIGHVLAAVAPLNGTIAVVIGPDHQAVAEEIRARLPGAEVFTQTERKGTAHAVLAAKAAIERGYDDLVVVFGDTPLIRSETLQRLRAELAGGAAVAVLGFRAADPSGYGRLVVERGELVAIREDKDASERERAIDFCNAGVMALSGACALELLTAIGNSNANREFYLTDAVDIAHAKGLKVTAIETQEDEVRGVNTREQLAEVETILHRIEDVHPGRGALAGPLAEAPSRPK
jgi:bifunctional UDP-N-acetylglucosamine pyrophosphorylase/glucosamine-1-phosphate N-acetyltransferase